MEVEYDGQNAFVAAANGDFPLVVLIWGMAIAVRSGPVDLLTAVDPNGNSIMHCAASAPAEANTTPIIHFILQQTHAAGKDLVSIVEAKNHAGETPLIRAAHVGNLQVVQVLLQFAHANLHAQDGNGYSAAEHAASQGHLWTLHYLLQTETQHDTSQYHVKLLEIAHTREDKLMTQYLSRALTIPPTSCRQTRAWLVFTYGAVVCAFLSTVYFLPYWISLPCIGIGAWILKRALRSKGSGHNHGHSHSKSNLESIHPSKRDIPIPAFMSITSLTPPSRPVSRFFQPQPELMMGIWMGWVALFTVFYIIIWMDPLFSDLRTRFHSFLISIPIFQAFFLLTWIRLALISPSDPGVISSFAQDVSKMLEIAAQGIPPPITTHCRSCYIHKPLRSKHCAHCGVCIARMDHHCAWINRCVGYGNHRLFLLFLFLHVVLVSFYMILSFYAISSVINLDATHGSKSMQIWIQLPHLIHDHLLSVIVFLWSILCFVLLGNMLREQIVNVTKNLTVNETLNWKRYTIYLQPNDKSFLNAFDHGKWRNFQEFWFHSMNYHTVFKVEQESHEMHSMTSEKQLEIV